MGMGAGGDLHPCMHACPFLCYLISLSHCVQSFHFSPKLPFKDWKASEAAHEARIAVTLGLRPGMKALDCGCGVGGPLRTVASVSGAHVTGITINEYQVKVRLAPQRE